PSGSVLTSSLGWVYRGDFMQRVNNNTLIDPIDAYTIINFTASFQPANSSLSYDLMIMNATDEDGVNSSMTDVFGANATGLELIPPRQIMGRVTAKF
ncbi:MAG: TonB-dependent receptor, partial [Porticoccaceae bacterium]|nr:TonB-dependent receptor [Porticoccaceae bacterium]